MNENKLTIKEKQLLEKADKLVAECRKMPKYTVLTDGEWICVKFFNDDVLLQRYNEFDYKMYCFQTEAYRKNPEYAASFEAFNKFYR